MRFLARRETDFESAISWRNSCAFVGQWTPPMCSQILAEANDGRAFFGQKWKQVLASSQEMWTRFPFLLEMWPAWGDSFRFIVCARTFFGLSTLLIV
jgi:hypothetical protein